MTLLEELGFTAMSFSVSGISAGHPGCKRDERPACLFSETKNVVTFPNGSDCVKSERQPPLLPYKPYACGSRDYKPLPQFNPHFHCKFTFLYMCISTYCKIRQSFLRIIQVFSVFSTFFVI